MPTPVKNEDVEQSLRSALAAEGFTMNPKLGYGETGVDILATRHDERYHIEVIGYKKSPPARAKDFYESFFRAVSRLNDGATHCVIALADLAEAGLPARAKQHRVAWLRIADAFPELEIWLVDTVSKRYQRRTWGEWVEAT